MRLVLAGATGFVGGHLQQHLLSLGHECRVLHRPGNLQAKASPRRGVEYCQVDWSSQKSLDAALEGADGVINGIGILNEKVWEKGGRGSGFQAAHVGTVEALIQSCETVGMQRFIQVSALNAGLGSSYYLRSKGEAEKRLRDAAAIDETIVQPAVIFGEGDSFFNRFAALLRFAPVLPLACPEARMQPVWVGDVAQAVASCLARRPQPGPVIECAGPEVMTLRQIVQRVGALAGCRRPVLPLPEAAGRLQAAAMGLLPGEPLMSRDNLLSMRVPNVASGKLPGLDSLGITPAGIDLLAEHLNPVDPRHR